MDSAKYIIESRKFDSDMMRLVHGIVINSLDSEPMIHAWVEICGELVIDVAHDSETIFTREQYYESGQISETVKYDYKQTLKNLTTHGHYGPWDINCKR